MTASDEPEIRLREEDPDEPGNAIRDRDRPCEGGARILAGDPSPAAIELMLEHIGFRCRRFDWHAGSAVSDWQHLGDSRDGRRVTIVASRAR